MKKCIFLSVSGQTPQIITETLFKLREEGREIVDIYVVTTSTGKNNILKCLLGIDPNDGSTVGKNIFIEMSREYGWNEITLNKDKIGVFTDNTDRQLEDIRTDEDERIAADFLFQTVYDLEQNYPDIPIVASIAGGRKTMSYLMGTVMSILGRKDDELTHVLVDPRFENIDIQKSGGQFYYPSKEPKTYYTRQTPFCPALEIDGSTAAVELSFIPYIRMNHFLKESKQWKKLMSSKRRNDIYSHSIEYINSEMTLNISDVFITLDFKNSAICVEIKKQIRPATYRIELKPIQFALYAMLLDYMINKHKKVKTPANQRIDKDERFNNWIQIYSYLPVDLSNIEAFRFQDQIEEEINDIIDEVNNNIENSAKDPYTLDKIKNFKLENGEECDAYALAYQAVYDAWFVYKNNVKLDKRMSYGIGNKNGEKKVIQLHHTYGTFIDSQYELWRSWERGINSAIAESNCPETVARLISVSEKDGSYIIGQQSSILSDEGINLILSDKQFDLSEVKPARFTPLVSRKKV